MTPGPARDALLRHIPAALQAIPAWLPWMPVARPGGRTGKAPAMPVEGRLRPVDYRRGGLELATAIDLAEEYGASGIGLVLMPDAPWICLDVDGEVPDWVDTLRTLLGTSVYAETSPSGAGVHLWLPFAGALNRHLPGLDLINWGFVTFTGAVWPAPAAKASAPALLNPATGKSPDRALTDDQVVRRLCRARNGARAGALLGGDWTGYPTRSEADFALVRMLRWWTQDRDQILRLMRGSGLRREKWTEHGYLERTVDRALNLGGPVWQGGRRG